MVRLGAYRQTESLQNPEIIFMTQHSALQIIRDEHASLAAMLQSMRMMVQRGPADDRRNFFDVLRAMLFYIDEFPERLHHPKESNLLFPKVVKLAPKVMGAIDKLERDHMNSEKAARDLARGAALFFRGRLARAGRSVCRKRGPAHRPLPTHPGV